MPPLTRARRSAPSRSRRSRSTSGCSDRTVATPPVRTPSRGADRDRRIRRPPPPPPAPPQNVPPTALDANRIAGEKNIIPDDVTKTEISRSGKEKLIGSYKLCITAAGTISSVGQLKSTGFPAYDSKIQNTIRGEWRYRPFIVNGKAAPVCTAVTFIYSQK
jgi:hypothetical protein